MCNSSLRDKIVQKFYLVCAFRRGEYHAQILNKTDGSASLIFQILEVMTLAQSLLLFSVSCTCFVVIGTFNNDSFFNQDCIQVEVQLTSHFLIKRVRCCSFQSVWKLVSASKL